MIVGVNFDGVKVEVEVALSDSIKVVIKRALGTIFPPESLPPVDGCVATLDGAVVSHRRLVGEIDFSEYLLNVTIPF